MKVLESVPQGKPGGVHDGSGAGGELVRVPAPCPRHRGEQAAWTGLAGDNPRLRLRHAETRTASGALISLNHWALALGVGAPLPGPAGCECAFTCISTGRAVSAAVVADRPFLTVGALRALLLESCRGQFPGDGAETEAEKITEVAALYPAGTVLATGPGASIAVARHAAGPARPPAGFTRRPAPWLHATRQHPAAGPRT